MSKQRFDELKAQRRADDAAHRAEQKPQQLAGRAERRRMQRPFGRKRIRGVMAVPPMGRPWRKREETSE